MSVHKRNNGTWYVHWRDVNNRQHAKNFGKESDSQSKALEFDSYLKKENLAKRGYDAKFSKVMYLDTIAQMWINAKKADGCAIKWITDWTNILQKYLLAELCEKPIVMYSRSEIVDLFVKKFPKVKDITRNRYISYLKVMINWAVDQELIEKNPLSKWKKPDEASRNSLLRIEDLKKIYNCSPPHLKWAIEVAYNFGVRTGPSELLSLKWYNIDFDNAMLDVFGRKTEKWRKIPIRPEFLNRLIEMKKLATSEYIIEYRGRKISSLKKSFKNACKLAKIPYDVTTYDIRHLFATSSLNKGADLSAVSRIMGHCSTKMTVDNYYHIQENEKRHAVGLLPPLY